MGKIPEPYKDKNFKASYEKDSISSDIHFNPSWQKRLIKSPVVSGSAPAWSRRPLPSQSPGRYSTQSCWLKITPMVRLNFVILNLASFVYCGLLQYAKITFTWVWVGLISKLLTSLKRIWLICHVEKIQRKYLEENFLWFRAINPWEHNQWNSPRVFPSLPLSIWE